MSSAVSMIGPKFYAWDSATGEPLAFGKVYTYESGTSTPKPTFQGEDASAQNPNPVILNGAGYAEIYLVGSYKVVLTDADDVTVWTADPVSKPFQFSAEWMEAIDATQVSGNVLRVDGNQSGLFTVGRRVKLDDTTTLYGIVTGVNFVSGNTDVTVEVDDGTALTTSLATVSLAAVQGSSLAITTETGPQTLADALKSRVIYVTNIAELKALPTSYLEQYQGVVVSGGNKSGVYSWQTGDQSANITADPDEKIWVAPSSEATGSGGAWQRGVSLQLDSSESYAYLYHPESLKEIVRWSDGVSSSGAHRVFLPIEARRNSHGFILSAGTAGGGNDILFRNSNFEDRLYLDFDYNTDIFTILVDLTPSPTDGGSGYAFDAAMSVGAGGASAKNINFQALPVIFSQNVSMKKRSVATFGIEFELNDTSVDINNSEDGAMIASINPDYIRLGGVFFQHLSSSSIPTNRGSYKIAKTTRVITESENYVVKLTSSNSVNGILELNLAMRGSGSGSWVYRKISKFVGATLTDIDSFDDLAGSGITVTISDVGDGGLTLTVDYGGGWGTNLRASFVANVSCDD